MDSPELQLAESVWAFLASRQGRMTGELHLNLLLNAFARMLFILFLFVLSYVGVFLWLLRLLENLLLSLPAAVRCARRIRAAWHVPAQIFYRITLLLAAAASGYALLFETNTIIWPAPESGPIALWGGALLGAMGASCGFAFIQPIRRRHKRAAEQAIREIMLRKSRISIW